MLKYDFVIYPRKLWIGTRQECLDNFTDRNNAELDLIPEDSYEALSLQVVERESLDYGFFVILQEKARTSIIAHEATHVALDLFNDLDISIAYNNQEPLAYLIGFISKCIANYES